MAIEDRTGMKPRLGATTMTLPITFDYSGGRDESNKSKKLWSWILGILGVIISVGMLISDRAVYIKVPLALIIAYIFMFIIRFILLGEFDKKEEYKRLESEDYKLSYQDIWGIYKVEETHPYICRFRNGKSGVYILLNKDVILGKYMESEYNHYEAIADAYNLAGAGKVQMVHIDYMDSVGSDERLAESLVSLGEVQNADLRDLLTDMYNFQQRNILSRVTTFDVYAFLWTGNDITAWGTINRILNCFLEANYRSYRVLAERDLRDLSKVIFNLEDFSVVEASSSVFSDNVKTSITPISISDEYGNVTILNNTSEERKAEAKAKLEEAEARKREIERRKKEKKSRHKKGVKGNKDKVGSLDDVL